jgi:hypothetical protein
VIEPAHLFRRRFHDDGLAHGHLAIAGNRCSTVFLDGDYRRTPEFQSGYPPISSPARFAQAGRFYLIPILAQSGRIRPHSCIRFQFFHEFSIIRDFLPQMIKYSLSRIF